MDVSLQITDYSIAAKRGQHIKLLEIEVQGRFINPKKQNLKSLRPFSNLQFIRVDAEW